MTNPRATTESVLALFAAEGHRFSPRNLATAAHRAAKFAREDMICAAIAARPRSPTRNEHESTTFNHGPSQNRVIDALNSSLRLLTRVGRGGRGSANTTHTDNIPN